MSEITILSPPDVGQLFLQAGNPISQQITNSFNLFRIQEILPFLSLPNPPFRNTHHGIILIESGEIQISIDEQLFSFGPQHLIITPASQLNGFQKIHPHSQGFMGTFSDHTLQESTFSRGSLPYSQLLSPNHLPHFKLEDHLFTLFKATLTRLHSFGDHKHPSSQAVVTHHLVALLTELYLFRHQTSYRQPYSHEQLIVSFKQLLCDEPIPDLKPKNLAQKLCVSVNHLNKVLRAHTGQTTTDWITARKLTTAKHLLLYTTKTVTQIGYALGFEEPAYFSRFFHRYTGSSPSSFRKD